MIALGIDPAFAKDKPVAIVAVNVELMRITGVCETIAGVDTLWDRFHVWKVALDAMMGQQHPDVVGIEAARGKGGSGSAHLWTLVDLLYEQVTRYWHVPCYRINQNEAKALADCANLPTKVAQRCVGRWVRMMLANPEALLDSPDDDYASAVLMAIAADKELRKERMRGESV